MSMRTRIQKGNSNATYGAEEFPKAGLDFDTSGNPFIQDPAGTNQLGVSSSGVVVSALRWNGVAATALAGLALVGIKTIPLDATATDFLTVTIPNIQASCILKVTAFAMLGTGGAIGASEGVRGVEYLIVITRTAGVNAVIGLSAVAEAAAANVAGGTTAAATITAGSVGGAVGAVNTFAIKTTITAGAGTLINHRLAYKLEFINVDAAGITIAAA